MLEERNMRLDGIAPFGIQIRKVDVFPDDPENTHDHHIHERCEIYVNITGEVSFMVEDKIYPVRSGSVIITRPYEYHHCIYHGNEHHKHLWMLFDGKGNEELLPLFYSRNIGENNLIELSEKQLDKVKELFDSIIHKKQSPACETADFLRIITILENADGSLDKLSDSVPADISRAIAFIGENLGNVITVSEVAKAAHISVNTLERRFLDILKVTPSGYIKSRRLARAAELLPLCSSVGEVCEKCGFQDYSNFIAIFKKQFGVTPLKFKKMYEKKSQGAEVIR